MMKNAISLHMCSIVWHHCLKWRKGVYEKAIGAAEFCYWAFLIVVNCGHHQENSGETIKIKFVYAAIMTTKFKFDR